MRLTRKEEFISVLITITVGIRKIMDNPGRLGNNLQSETYTAPLKYVHTD